MAYNLSARASQLLRKLSAADFYAQDLKLFLDTHPTDTKALELYREAVKQTEACRCAFENEFRSELLRQERIAAGIGSTGNGYYKEDVCLYLKNEHRYRS